MSAVDDYTKMWVNDPPETREAASVVAYADAAIAELEAEKAVATDEVRAIDATLARRPALADITDRLAKIERACSVAGMSALMAGRAEQAEAELALSRGQTTYANDAMYAMQQSRDSLETELAALKAENAKYQPWKASYFDMRDQRDKAERELAALKARDAELATMVDPADPSPDRCSECGVLEAELAAVRSELATAHEIAHANARRAQIGDEMIVKDRAELAAEKRQSARDQKHYREKWDTVQSELAALKAQRCETCEANDKQYCPIPTRSNIIAARPSFSCSEWEARP